MVHPLIPQVLELAAPVAAELGLEVVEAVFQTNQSPPVLRIAVRSLENEDTGLDDCEKMSQAFEAVLDTSDIIPDAYVLEVSSPVFQRPLKPIAILSSSKGSWSKSTCLPRTKTSGTGLASWCAATKPPSFSAKRVNLLRSPAIWC
jgi:ribosome maturation factor RimP